VISGQAIANGKKLHAKSGERPIKKEPETAQKLQKITH
jgi:hypothetical protein